MCTRAGHVGNVVDTLRGIILDAPEYHGLEAVLLRVAPRFGVQILAGGITTADHGAPLAWLKLNLRWPGIVVADGTLVNGVFTVGKRKRTAARGAVPQIYSRLRNRAVKHRALSAITRHVTCHDRDSRNCR